MSDVGLTSRGEVDAAELRPARRHGRPVSVLLVEDDPADARLLRRAVERGGVAVELTWVSDGEQALDLLRDRLQQGQDLPDLLLLDLNMPMISGHEVLAAIRREPGLRHLAVIILSTSRSPMDVQRAYADNANAFVRKPAEFEGFVQVLRSIEGFWFDVADLPGRTDMTGPGPTGTRFSRLRGPLTVLSVVGVCIGLVLPSALSARASFAEARQDETNSAHATAAQQTGTLIQMLQRERGLTNIQLTERARPGDGTATPAVRAARAATDTALASWRGADADPGGAGVGEAGAGLLLRRLRSSAG